MIYVNTDFLKNNPDAIVIDCRFNMQAPEEGKKKYEYSHLKGAFYVDLDQDLMGKTGEHGGRHPLPKMDDFRKKMENLGISNDSVVILYDDGLFPISSRLCFMLKMLGKDSYILNGGYPEIEKAGLECDNKAPQASPSSLTTKPNYGISVDIDYVLANKDKPNVALVDSRSSERYLGIEEPMDEIAGRIPGALNLYWKDNFEGTKLKSKQEIEKNFAELEKYDEVIFHCGSGVTGAVNSVIYESLGKKAKLYGGSFSDYITHKGLELIIKDDKKITL